MVKHSILQLIDGSHMSFSQCILVLHRGMGGGGESRQKEQDKRNFHKIKLQHRYFMTKDLTLLGAPIDQNASDSF